MFGSINGSQKHLRLLGGILPGTALSAVLAAAFFPAASVYADYNVEQVSVNVQASEGEIPPSVSRRITASIAAIGSRVLVGQPVNVFRLNEESYDKVLADIVNRVVVGYVVTDIHVSYDTVTTIQITLQPVGEIIQSVDTEIDYGNLTPQAVHLLQSDLGTIQAAMENLLVGLPVDSVNWAESVSQAAGRDVLAQSLPEFTANLEVTPGVHTKVHIFLIPTGDIIRECKVSFRRTTVPRIMLYTAVNKTEDYMSGLEGLPVLFAERHRQQILDDTKTLLVNDPFIRKYGISVNTNLQVGEDTELKVDALTDRWVIQSQAWMDMGREGNKVVTVEGLLGRYAGKHDLFFGEARFYPGPVDWDVYAGWGHRFGNLMTIGYKYDITDSSNHLFIGRDIGERWHLRYERDLQNDVNETGLSYKLHNYFTLEYVRENNKNWLRMIANL